MEGKNNDREFEQFLKENADHHRLYPTEEVWHKIHARLHPSKRLPLTALLLLTITAGSITWLSNGDRSIESAPAKMIASNPVERVSTSVKNITAPPVSNFVTEQAQTPIVINTSAENRSIATSTAEDQTATTITESDYNVAQAVPTSATETNKPNNATIAKIAAEFSAAPKAEDTEKEQLPLSIESVTNSYQRQKK